MNDPTIILLLVQTAVIGLSGYDSLIGTLRMMSARATITRSSFRRKSQSDGASYVVTGGFGPIPPIALVTHSGDNPAPKNDPTQVMTQSLLYDLPTNASDDYRTTNAVHAPVTSVKCNEWECESSDPVTVHATLDNPPAPTNPANVGYSSIGTYSDPIVGMIRSLIGSGISETEVETISGAIDNDTNRDAANSILDRVLVESAEAIRTVPTGTTTAYRWQYANSVARDLRSFVNPSNPTETLKAAMRAYGSGPTTDTGKGAEAR